MATTNGRPHTATGTPKEKTHTLRGSVSLADTTATATCGMLLSEPGSMGGTGGVRGAAPGTVTGSALGAKGAAPRPDRPPAGSVGLAALAREMQERGDANGGPDKARSAANGQQPEWRVKVRERKVKEKGRKVREPAYTLLFSTPDGELALARTLKDIVHLDSKVRPDFDDRLGPRPAILGAISAGSKRSKGDPSPTTTSSRRTRTVLQTISRTLSPVKKSSKIPSFGSFSGGRDEADDAGPPGSTTSNSTAVPNGTTRRRKRSDEEYVPVDLSTLDKSALASLALGSEHSAERQLEHYLGRLVGDEVVRSSAPWKSFVKVGREDFSDLKGTDTDGPLGLPRTSADPGLKRARSDLATHTLSASLNLPSSFHPSTTKIVSPEESERRRLSDARREAEEALGLTAQDALQLERLAAGGSLQNSSVDLLGPSTPTVAGHPVTTPASRVVDRNDEPPVEKGKAAPAVQPAAEEDVAAKDGPAGSKTEGHVLVEREVTTEEEVDLNDVVDPAGLGNSTTPSAQSSPSPKKTDVELVDSPSPAPLSSFDSSIISSVTTSGSPSSHHQRQRRTLRSRKTTVADFEIMRVLGKGCAGKVLMVRHKRTGGVYAMKSIQKGHVLAHRELQHTLTEQSVLKRVADDQSNPFIVKLWWSFHDVDHLFLVMDFYNGGDLATLLARWGRLGRDRARFYAAEISAGVQGLHAAGVVYRDLKPENVLIAADGHVVLTDFGLSRQFPREHEEGSTARKRSSRYERETTTTFCGTSEYLAPEVLLGEPYSYEVDWWSFGTMLYEMLTGQTPFWSEDHPTMYRRVLHEELHFTGEEAAAMDQDTRTLLRGLLQRDPSVRMTGARIKKHPYFGMIDWDHVYHKRYIAPFVPETNPDDATDTRNFDEAFLSMEPTYVQDDDAPGSPEGEDKPEVEPEERYDEHGRDVFDGYSYLAPRADRDSVLDFELEHRTDSPEIYQESEEASQGARTEPAAEDMAESYDHGNLTSSSVQTSSTRPTSVEKDPSASSRHDRIGSQGLDSLTENGDETGETEPSEADEDWDVVVTPEAGMWDRNGKRGNTLFARGVVDKYRMRMLRTGDSTPPVANRVLPRRGSSQVSMPQSDSDTGTGLSSLLASAPASRSSSSHRQPRFRLRQKRPATGDSPNRPRTPDSPRVSERTLGPPRKSMSDPPAFNPESKPSFSSRANRKAKMKRLALSSPRTLFSPSKAANSSPPRLEPQQ